MRNKVIITGGIFIRENFSPMNTERKENEGIKADFLIFLCIFLGYALQNRKDRPGNSIINNKTM